MKKYWKEIVIVVLALFCLNRCTVGCNRSQTISSQESELTAKDSVVNIMSDSIRTLNAKIAVYEEKISGMADAAKIQEQALKSMTEAKKNISVTVKK